MKTIIKAALSRVAPGLYATVTAQRARRRSQILEREWGYTDLAHRVLEGNGTAVSSGPFEGLKFAPRTFDRHISPKLFGSYEAALNPLWQDILARPYAQILDVGCADGYFAVGIARRMPGATVHAFDTDPWARLTVRQMSEANETSNLAIHGACSPDWLARNLRPGAFILSDCEGYEDALFVPESAPNLRSADLLIELHEEAAPGVTERLLSRFRTTHTSMIVKDGPRSPEDYPASAFLPDADRVRALHEVRSDGQEWLFLSANGR
jgi:hypothetical protein